MTRDQGYHNAGKPKPPYVELRDVPNGALFRNVSGRVCRRVRAWKDDPDLCVIIEYVGDNKTHMCSTAHVLPLPAQCQRCGSGMPVGVCTDETCPFSDCEQWDERGWAGHPSPPVRLGRGE